jgi:hypothetical protein
MIIFEPLVEIAIQLEVLNLKKVIKQNALLQKEPASITVYHAVTQDNNGQLGPYATQFDLKADGTLITGDGQIVEINSGDSFQITAADVEGYSFVLIAGDTKCPTNLGDDIILESGEHINCWVYHDDDFVEGQTGGDGIIFHRNSLLFTYNGFGMANPLTGVGACVIDGSVSPCIERIGDKDFRVKDTKLNKDSAIVVFNVFPTIEAGNEDAFSDECRIFRVSLGTLSELNFEFTCTEITGDNGVDIGPKHYRINYAVIDTM